MAERLGHALDDGETESEAADCRTVGRGAALKLLEDHLAIFLANAGTGIPYLDAHRVGAAPREQQDAASVGVLDGVSEQILQDAAQHQRIGHDAEACATP